MRNLLKIFLIASFGATMFSPLGVLAGEASQTTEAIVERMIEAHGGMERWKAAPSITYDFVMYLPAIPMSEGMSPWDIWRASSHGFEPKTGHAYVVLPFESARLMFNGTKIVNEGYKGGNPPMFRLYHHATHINLPWLVRSPRVRLSEPGKGNLPNDSTEYITLRMTFTAPPGKKHDGYYEIYIDPETYLLKASVYTSMYSVIPDALHPPEVRKMPMPFLRINNGYVTVDGLTFPSRYLTYDPEGKEIFGFHLVLNVSTSRSFDETSRMREHATNNQ